MSIGGFNPPWERHEVATHASRLEYCLVFSLIVFQATPAENVWPPRSKSARSQVSAALFYVQTVAFVLAWICTDDTQASRQQAKGRRYYLSQNIGPVVPGSAGPTPPPLILQLDNPMIMQYNASLVPRALPNFLLFAVWLSVL